jgi:murein DD-endopeptidase MepM/ murein hydrolase activator NlpD
VSDEDDPSIGPGSGPTDRLRRALPDPTTLSTLGLVSIPGFLVPSLERLQVFALFFLFGFWPLLSALLPSRGDSPSDWVAIGDAAYGRRAVLTSIPTFVNPWVQWQGLKQLLGQVAVLARYRGHLPSPETHEQSTDLRLPFDGEWTVVNGSYEKAHSHSWGVYAQRYAYDFVVTDAEGWTHEGDGTRADQYRCWDEPILAPADGVVAEASDGHRDYPKAGGRIDPLQRDIRGNYVVLDHGDGAFSVFAHLREGSVSVREGERVDRGQRVGRCGNSGNSTEPHLHYHVQDRASFYTGMGLPVRFDDLRRDAGPGTDRETVARGYVSLGQRVTPLPDE